MIQYQTRYGTVTVSNEYFAKIIGKTVTSCYGVSSMVATGKQWIRSKLSKKEYIDTGIIPNGDTSYIVPIVCLVDKAKVIDNRSDWQKEYIKLCTLNTLRKKHPFG